MAGLGVQFLPALTDCLKRASLSAPPDTISSAEPTLGSSPPRVCAAQLLPHSQLLPHAQLCSSQPGSRKSLSHIRTVQVRKRISDLFIYVNINPREKSTESLTKARSAVSQRPQLKAQFHNEAAHLWLHSPTTSHLPSRERVGEAVRKTSSCCEGQALHPRFALM